MIQTTRRGPEWGSFGATEDDEVGVPTLQHRRGRILVYSRTLASSGHQPSVGSAQAISAGYALLAIGEISAGPEAPGQREYLGWRIRGRLPQRCRGRGRGTSPRWRSCSGTRGLKALNSYVEQLRDCSQGSLRSQEALQAANASSGVRH